MASHVFMADMRAGTRENLHDKLLRLIDNCQIEKKIDKGDLVAIKLHFGERGGHAYIRPTFVRQVVDRVRELGGKPFLTDSSTLYPGQRKEAVSALDSAIANGFAYAVVDAPLIMSDGLRGHSSRRVKLDGGVLDSVDIGLEILEADGMIVLSHFKCHELTGIGGAIKNLAMGCSSREGKMEQHSTVAPQVAEKYCTACADCLKACAHEAIRMIEGVANIDEEKCTGCGRCISICEQMAIRIQWNEQSEKVMLKMADYARGATSGKGEKLLYVNFVTQVSPACDCYGHSDAPIVPDIGILASTDPVALDQACADLVNQASGLPESVMETGHEPGQDKFRSIYPQIDWETTLSQAEKVGLGSREYELTRLEPLSKSW
ncbi:MAG: 4Fe-4S ferredoxin [Desulfuromonas sp.]|nr:MAG: 4Fe-4S ferredoxin [Desulfuromonas sp.]